MNWLPEHKCGLYLEHNSHKDVYETIEESYDPGDFVSEKEWLKAVENNSVWRLQWYPDTPIGFYIVCASTLEAVEEAIRARGNTAIPVVAAPQARQPTYGWLIACDDARVTAHLGVAELSHSYAYAKKALNELIDWHIAVATDPAVNGGFSLQARQPLNEISISAAWAKVMHGTTGPLPLIEFARAIEAAHNIKEGT